MQTVAENIACVPIKLWLVPVMALVLVITSSANTTQGPLLGPLGIAATLILVLGVVLVSSAHLLVMDCGSRSETE